jgi:2-polyprenyl-3-methyl-5-hydroxy-6-metoxy-1,4-benzoquinol methylase
MDMIFAPIYDQDWGSYINDTHRRFLDHFLILLPARAVILDAACGTGKYWPAILETGRSLQGVDQSAGMLEQASAKYPHVPIRKVGLQELDYEQPFDGIICMDAMENVFPEDWPLVMANFHKALKPAGYLHFTVELIDPDELQAIYLVAKEMGLPVVEGEHVLQGDPQQETGYHYYPSIQQVRDWTRQARLSIVEEDEGDDYYHILAQKEKDS